MMRDCVHQTNNIYTVGIKVGGHLGFGVGNHGPGNHSTAHVSSILWKLTGKPNPRLFLMKWYHTCIWLHLQFVCIFPTYLNFRCLGIVCIYCAMDSECECVCCVSVVHSPVRWRIVPPARLGPALGVEPGQLGTGWRPAGSPYSQHSPSCTHHTAIDEHTHLQIHTRRQTHVVGHYTGNRDADQGLSLALPSCVSLSRLSVSPGLPLPVSVSLVSPSPQTVPILSLHLLCLCLPLMLKMPLLRIQMQPCSQLPCHVSVCMLIWDVCCVWACVADQPVNLPPPPTHKERERAVVPSLCLSLSLSLPATVFVYLAPPALSLSLLRQWTDAATSSTPQHTRSYSKCVRSSTTYSSS